MVMPQSRGWLTGMTDDGVDDARTRKKGERWYRCRGRQSCGSRHFRNRSHESRASVIEKAIDLSSKFFLLATMRFDPKIVMGTKKQVSLSHTARRSCDSTLQE